MTSESHDENLDEALIQRAAALLRAGEVVAFPTETVYGLGADASNPVAVGKIFTWKGRPADHPLIVHLGAASQLADWASDVPAQAWQLAHAFWPGPLTLILRKAPHVLDVVTGGLDTVGLRVPRHPVALALLRAFGGGVAAPSANQFGRVSPTRAAHVRDEFGDALPLVLDGGPCEVGLESTIVDLSGATPTLLRPGGVTREQLEAVLGVTLADAHAGSPRAPGRLASHYAPRARVVLVAADALVEQLTHWQQAGQRVAVITLHPEQIPSVNRNERLVVIPLAADLEQCARDLYLALREVDLAACDVALVTLPAGGGLAEAIADRLRRAAGQGT